LLNMPDGANCGGEKGGKKRKVKRRGNTVTAYQTDYVLHLCSLSRFLEHNSVKKRGGKKRGKARAQERATYSQLRSFQARTASTQTSL